MESCQTCHSELPNKSLAAYINPCCSTPICARCVAQNPRLRCHVPCLRCGDAKAGDQGAYGRAIRRAGDRSHDESHHEVQFAIGDDDDDDEGAGGDGEGGGDSIDAASAEGTSQSDTFSPDDAHRSPSVNNAGQDVEPTTEVVEVKHRVARGDTLMSIARRYAADPHDLLKLNALPATALSTNPRILQTRRELVISRRTVIRHPHSSGLADDSAYASTSNVVDVLTEQEAAERAQRQAERSIKRFQLLTKTEDPAVGRVYLELAKEGLMHAGASSSSSTRKEGKDGSAEKVGKEEGVNEAFELALASYESDLAAGTVAGTGGGEKVVSAPSQARRRLQAQQGGSMTGQGGVRGDEQDALDAFYSDEEWEARSGGPSRRVAARAPADPSGGNSAGGIWPSLKWLGGGAAGKGKSNDNVRDRDREAEGRRWMVSPSTGPRAVEAFQKA